MKVRLFLAELPTSSLPRTADDHVAVALAWLALGFELGHCAWIKPDVDVAILGALPLYADVVGQCGGHGLVGFRVMVMRITL